MKTYYSKDVVIKNELLTETIVIPETFWEYIVLILNYIWNFTNTKLIFVEVNPNNSLDHIGLETYYDWEELIINWPIYKMGLFFYTDTDIAKENLNAMDA